MAGALEQVGTDVVEMANAADSSFDISHRVEVYQRLLGLGVPLPVPFDSQPKPRSSPSSVCTSSLCCFGVALEETCHRCTVLLSNGDSASLPGFLVTVISYLEDFMSSAGLFRKTGSLQKQRCMRATICEQDGDIPEEMSEYDAANLLKQYLRLLPGGVIPVDWRECLLAIAGRYENSPQQLSDTILDVCFLLPQLHRSALQYICGYFNRLTQISTASISREKLAIVLAPSLMQCSSASNNDLGLYTLILLVLIEKAWELGTTSLAADIALAEACASPVRQTTMTPTGRYDTPTVTSYPSMSPATELRSLRQKRTLHSAAASPGRIALGKCVDSRLMEICSSTESLAFTPSPKPVIVKPAKVSPEGDGREEKRQKKRRRRSSLSGLVSSIGQTFERLKSTKAASQAQDCRDDSRQYQAPAIPEQKLKFLTPIKNRPVVRRPSLPRQAKSRVKRGKLAAVHPTAVRHPMSPQKRKAPADQVPVLSPMKRKAILQSLATQGLVIKQGATDRLARPVSRPKPKAATLSPPGSVSSVSVLQPAAARENVHPSKQVNSLDKPSTSPGSKVLYQQQETKENLAPRQTSSLKRDSGTRRSSWSLRSNISTQSVNTCISDSDDAKVKALMVAPQPTMKTRLRRRLSGGLTKKHHDEDEKVAHILEVGERLAHLRPSNPSSRVPSTCSTPTHIRWRAPPGTLPPTNSPGAFPCTVPTGSAHLATDSQDKGYKRLSLPPPESPLTCQV